MSKLKLEPSLIPESAWGQSLANLHRQNRCKYWPTLRDDAITKHGTSCVFCPSLPEHAHEVWRYDEWNAVMTLDDIVPICQWCHHVVHLGRTEVLASKGELDLKAVLQHFATVREINQSQIEAIARDAFDLWEVRSRKQWTVEFGKYARFIHEPGQLPDIALFDDPPVHDKDRKPSETKHVKWLSVNRDNSTLTVDRDRHGVFLLKGKISDMDVIWEEVARLTIVGKLGINAYASTEMVRQTSLVFRDNNVIGVVFSAKGDKDAIESTLQTRFGKMVKITYKQPG